MIGSQINTAEKCLHKQFEIIPESSNLQCQFSMGQILPRCERRKESSVIGLCETASASLGLQTSKPCLFADHE